MKRLKTSFPIAGLIVLVVVLTSAIGQTGRDRGGGGYAADPDLRELQETVRRHEVRIEQLEARAAQQTPGYLDEAIVEAQVPPAPRSAAGRMPERIMILDSIEPVEADPAGQDELERLLRDVESLERTVDQMERKTASMAGAGGGGYHRRYKSTSSGRRRSAQGQLMADYKSKLRAKQGEAKRLERELNAAKQVIHGHWKAQIITLETTRDMSRTLDRMEQGGYLTWDGRRLRADKASQEWIVTRIETVDRATVDIEE
jgi:hypothetical protein